MGLIHTNSIEGIDFILLWGIPMNGYAGMNRTGKECTTFSSPAYSSLFSSHVDNEDT